MRGGRAGRRRVTTSHATRSSRSSGGSRTSACSRNESTNERKAARLVTGSSTTTEPSASSSTTWSGPDVLHRPARLRAVDPHAGAHGRLGAELPGAAGLPGHGGGGRARRPAPSTSVDLALDAVEPVVALLVPEVVEAR